MQKLIINGTEYKIKYGFNSFADTSLLDEVQVISTLLNGKKAKNDADVNQLGQIKELFTVTRELLYVGLERYNPVEDLKACGDLIDDWHDESTDDESRGLLDLFVMLSEELTTEGFLADLMEQTQNNIKSIPQDRKRKAKNQ